MNDPVPFNQGAQIFCRRRLAGFTLVELMLAMGVLAVLLALALPAYADYKERIKVKQAITEIGVIGVGVKDYYAENGHYPETLGRIGQAMEDPWGSPYYYTDLSGKGAKGKARKDKKLNPLNSDFDLFSAGKDGVFKTQISNKDSADDIIRANDGRFIDLASKY